MAQQIEMDFLRVVAAPKWPKITPKTLPFSTAQSDVLLEKAGFAFVSPLYRPLSEPALAPSGRQPTSKVRQQKNIPRTGFSLFSDDRRVRVCNKVFACHEVNNALAARRMHSKVSMHF